MKNIVILTGAGISVESGIPTFRGNDGLWENHKVEDVATPEAFKKNPQLVHRFYNERRAFLKTVAPNQAHIDLVELEQNWKGDFLLVTQNIDNLHDRAGSKNLLHMHGELNKIFCSKCNDKIDFYGDTNIDMVCAKCNSVGTMRPDVVWFNEFPYHMTVINHALAQADIFVSIGTSGVVYPAAFFWNDVMINGRHPRTIEVNPSPSWRYGYSIDKVASLGVRELIDYLN